MKKVVIGTVAVLALLYATAYVVPFDTDPEFVDGYEELESRELVVESKISVCLSPTASRSSPRPRTFSNLYALDPQLAVKPGTEASRKTVGSPACLFQLP